MNYDNLDSILQEFADIYSLTKEDIEYFLLESIAEVENAKYALLSGDGIKLFDKSGLAKYQTLSKRKIKKVIDITKKKL